MNKKRIGFLIMLLSILIGLGSLNSAQANMSLPRFTASQADMLTQPMQYTSNNHIVGFLPHKVYLTGLDHTVSVEFINARAAQPQVVGNVNKTGGQGVAPLNQVRYQNVWNGIDVTYRATQDGIAKSEFTVAPNAEVSQIRLRYNASVELQSDGSLQFAVPNGRGYLTESAPVAWQEIDGIRVHVKVSFRVEQQDIGFDVARHDRRYPLVIDPIYSWHTFYGSSSGDGANGIALDHQGNVYIVGNSRSAWQANGTAPLHPFETGQLFVEKLDANGAYQWHTFYGTTDQVTGHGIAIDAADNVYVTGKSYSLWLGDGDAYPLHGDANVYFDFFILKLNHDGAYQWHTFYGSPTGVDQVWGIAVHENSIYVTGQSGSNWLGDNNTKPLHPFDTLDTFVLKLNSNGAYEWHTFYGSITKGNGVAVDDDGNVYITGISEAWQGDANTNPLHAHSGGLDIFVLKLDAEGAYEWHTFYGSSGGDIGQAVTTDANGNVYITGGSPNWLGDGGALPLHPHSLKGNIFVLKLDGNGVYQWHTFYGADPTTQGITNDDAGNGIVIDSENNVYVIGVGGGSWNGDNDALPLHEFAGECVPGPEQEYYCSSDIVVLKLTETGAYQWHTFYGESGASGTGIAVDAANNVYGAADGGAWRGDGGIEPLHAYSGAGDASIFKLMRPDNAMPLKPQNNAMVGKVRPRLTWTTASRAVNYHVELRKESRKGKKIADTFVQETKFKTPALMRGKKYFWRVQACNEMGCSDWTRWWKFEVKEQ